MELAFNPGMNLTKPGKKGTFEKPPMRNLFKRGIIAFFLGLVLVFGCAGPRHMDQTRFGIWAADRDLWDEAIFRWKKVLAQEPGSVAAHNNLAVAYEKKGLWEEARKEYEAALKLDPDNPWVKFNYKKFQGNLEPDGTDEKDDAAKREKK
jgi:tetratricopeptide (TPR) repeat protein